MKARMLVLASFVAVGARADNTQMLTIQTVLSTIDTQATTSQLNNVFSDPAAGLSAIALNPGNAYTIGVQVSAIHALTNYCPSPCADTATADQTLTTVITANSSAQTGSALLLLRAALESLGSLQVQSNSDLDLIDSFLQHPSRDIRASAARALRNLNNPCAIPPLRVRYQQEPTQQVQFAISDALAYLSSLPAVTCP